MGHTIPFTLKKKLKQKSYLHIPPKSVLKTHNCLGIKIQQYLLKNLKIVVVSNYNMQHNWGLARLPWRLKEVIEEKYMVALAIIQVLGLSFLGYV